MRFRRILLYRKIQKHKWKLMATAFILVFINSVHQMITCTQTHTSAFCEPIDVVYTWVNGSDPAFINSIKKYDPNYDPARFDDKNELMFSLRSLEKFAPWVRHIYIVTNGQIPKWLDLTNEHLTLVPHEVLVPNLQWLPTFSSAAIETFIHRIPNLSKRFIYLNDDIFLGTELYPEDLYTNSEGVKIYQAWIVPDCADDCSWTYIGDGACDHHCNIEACQFDGGDCSDEEIQDSSNHNGVIKFKELDENNAHKQITKDFSKSNHPLRNIHSKKTISLKNIFKQHKNLTTDVNLNIFVNDFNKKIQSQLQKKKQKAVVMEKESVEGNLAVSSKDVYSKSLIYTNMFLNRQYGFKARYVMGHVGFLLDKSIIKEMHEKFNDEIILTAKHRFRAPNDLQYAFAYYSFVMEETRKASIKEIFNDLDTDHSLTWSDREIRTLLAKTFKLPLDWSTVKFFEDVIHNCSLFQEHDIGLKIQYTTVIYERYEDSNLPTVTLDLVEKCTPLAEVLEANFALRRKYKYQILTKHSLYNNFMMLTSNVTDVVNALDKIRRNPRYYFELQLRGN